MVGCWNDDDKLWEGEKDQMSKVWKNLIIEPARSAGARFSQIKKIPYQAPPTQLGPHMYILEKRI